MSRTEKEGEEIEIDLGRIKNLFRRKEKPEAKEHEAAENREKAKETPAKEPERRKDKDSMEIDLGRIKEFFSGRKWKAGISRAVKAGKDPEEDASDDRMTGFVRKHHGLLLMALAIIVSAGIGIDIRMEAGDLMVAENIARNNVDSLLRSDIYQFTAQAHPNLPERNREALISSEIEKAYADNRYSFRTGQNAGQRIDDLESYVQLTASQIRPYFQDGQGRNYMPDIDTYYWLRYAENLLETGQIGDFQKDGKQWDDHQVAPIGKEIPEVDVFYPNAIVFFHRFVGQPFGTAIGANADLARTFMFFPVFLMALTSVLVFLIARRIAGNVAAFFAATMVSVHPVLMARTMFGHSDSDSLVVFLAVLVLWLMTEAFVAGKLKWKLAWASAAGLATGVYSMSWGGWWWIFDFMLAASGAAVGLVVLSEAARKSGRSLRGFAKGVAASVRSKPVRRTISAAAAYAMVSAAAVSIFRGIETALLVPVSALGFSTIKDTVTGSALPNVLRTVAELNEGTVRQAIDQVGGGFFWIAALGVALIALRAAVEAVKRKKNSAGIIRDAFFAAVLVIWFAATLYAVTKGIRFTILLIPAFSIAFGALAGMLASAAAWLVNREMKINKGLALAAVFVAVFLLFPGPAFNSAMVQDSRNAVRNDAPLINDAWANALGKIRENSQENAIITSWWDFGHHFKQIADRPVTFDGATQVLPQAHWVGRFLSTGSEKEAVGILRMLDCGAQTGTEAIKDVVKDEVDAFSLTKKIILENRSEAGKILAERGFAEEQAENVLDRTHCDPPEAFVIASPDMVGKSAVWGHFGGWNFTRADVWKATRGKNRNEALSYMKTRFGISEEEGSALFSRILSIEASPDPDRAADEWISPWPGFSPDIQGCEETEGLVACTDGLLANLTSGDAWYPGQEGNVSPVSFAYPKEGPEVAKKTYPDSAAQISVLLVPQGRGYARILASPQIVDGTFAKMFYLSGHGLKCFSPLTLEEGINVWKADWDCGQENFAPELAPGAGNGDAVTLNYVGFLDDGSVFDSSIADYGSMNVTNETPLDDSFSYTPFTFTIGTGQVIPGFERGIIGMEAGEEKLVVVPPELGYNAPGHELYNKTLNFRIRIVSIR